MSNTICPKCPSTKFETIIEKPLNAKFDLTYLRCSSCKTFLGVLESRNIGYDISCIQEDIDSIKKKLAI
jgi:hypothetical protein